MTYHYINKLDVYCWVIYDLDCCSFLCFTCGFMNFCRMMPEISRYDCFYQIQINVKRVLTSFDGDFYLYLDAPHHRFDPAYISNIQRISYFIFLFVQKIVKIDLKF